MPHVRGSIRNCGPCFPSTASPGGLRALSSSGSEDFEMAGGGATGSSGEFMGSGMSGGTGMGSTTGASGSSGSTLGDSSASSGSRRSGS